jgi:hypothetical protein
MAPDLFNGFYRHKDVVKSSKMEMMSQVFRFGDILNP